MFGIRRKPDLFHQETIPEESVTFLSPTKASEKRKLSKANFILWVLVAVAFAQAGVLGVQLWQWDTSAGVILPTNSLLATCKFPRDITLRYID